jgi:hypothetical protein
VKLFDILPIQLKLRLTERAIQRKFSLDIREAKKQQNTDEEGHLEFLRDCELSEVEEERRELLQRRLIRKANRLLIQVPRQPWEKNENENWERSPISGSLLLKDAAISNLAREIRKVRKERLDLWVPIISQLIALCGLGVAALSILLK